MLLLFVSNGTVFLAAEIAVRNQQALRAMPIDGVL